MKYQFSEIISQKKSTGYFTRGESINNHYDLELNQVVRV
jgi:hypothetical protein